MALRRRVVMRQSMRLEIVSETVERYEETISAVCATQAPLPIVLPARNSFHRMIEAARGALLGLGSPT